MVLFKGTTVNGVEVEGSLVVTNMFIKSKPKNHTKTWIIERSFGNGGWFNIVKRVYVKPDSVMQLINIDRIETWVKCEI